MNPRSLGVLSVFLLAIGVLVGYTLLGGGSVKAAPAVATDLLVGQAYEVADFATCKTANGLLRKEWHFGGADRSLRNQLTPELDGHGRKIFRVVKNDKMLPAGYMRLQRVSEADPTLEGFSYGTYAWEGLVVEYNGIVKPQRVVGLCGPAR